jgi:hypothetical protein
MARTLARLADYASSGAMVALGIMMIVVGSGVLW